MALTTAKLYTELPLKRAICLYMGTIGEAPEVCRGPIRNLLGWEDIRNLFGWEDIIQGTRGEWGLYIAPPVPEFTSFILVHTLIHTHLWWSPVVPYKGVFVFGSICVLTLSLLPSQ